MITFSGTKNGKFRSVPITAELEAKIVRHWKPLGHHLVPPRPGQDDHPPTERLGSSLPAPHLRQSLHPERREHPHTAEILGHFSLAMIMRYARLAPDHLQDAVRIGPLSSL
ncbi:hypothetical protein [Pseudomonas sediminis]|uniref:hypothetical protein n=1 Tax=Pseudomonas sediminis TaxID=1691904 RepID=UPI001FB6B0A1|nr:hypothetical protein [Pseudomonas sediminis]